MACREVSLRGRPRPLLSRVVVGSSRAGSMPLALEIGCFVFFRVAMCASLPMMGYKNKPSVGDWIGGHWPNRQGGVAAGGYGAFASAVRGALAAGPNGQVR